MGLELLTQSDEDKLISLAKKATKRVVKGENPTNVVAELSKKANLSPPMVERLCQALNIGRTVNLFKSSSSSDRLSEFPLADAAEVTSRIYGDDKPTSEKSAFYNKTVVTNFNDLLSLSALKSHSFEKAAKAVEHADRTGARSMSMQSAIQKAENVRAEYAITREKVAEAFNELNDYFRFYPARFEELESRAPAVFGKKASAVLETVYEGGSIRSFVKRGSPVLTPVVVGEEEREPYDLVGKCLQALEDMTKAAVVHINTENKVAKFRKEGGLFSFFSRKKGTGEPPPEEKQAGLLSFLAGALLRGKSELHRDTLGGVPSPDANPQFSPAKQEMKAVDAAVILHDIVSNDEVLSEVDPKLVLNIYNDLVQESPDLATHPILLRSVMRKAVSQGGILEPFELAQATGAATDMEKGRLSNIFAAEQAKGVGKSRGLKMSEPGSDYKAGPTNKQLEAEKQKFLTNLKEKRDREEEENRKLTVQHGIETQLQKAISNTAKNTVAEALKNKSLTTEDLLGVNSKKDLSSLAASLI